MKNLIKIIFLFCFVGLVGCHAPKPNLAKESDIVFRLAESMPPSHPAAQTSTYFAKLVEEKSKGHLKIKIYYTEDLGNEKSVLDQVQFGGIAMTRVHGDVFIESVTGLKPFFTLPLCTDSKQLMDCLTTNKQIIDDCCQTERYVLLTWLKPDLRCFYSDEQITATPNDLQGKNILAGKSSILQEAILSFGGNTAIGGGADIYKSMRSGYIDTVECTWGEAMTSNHYRFINHLTLTDYLAIPDALVISAEEYSVLSNDDRTLLNECSNLAAVFYEQLLETSHTQWKTKLIDDQIQVIESKPLNNILKTTLIQQYAKGSCQENNER